MYIYYVLKTFLDLSRLSSVFEPSSDLKVNENLELIKLYSEVQKN